MSLYDENVAKGLEAGGSFPASSKREVKSILLSLREKVIAYPVDWRPVRKAYSKLHTFFKTPCRNMGCFIV